MINKLFQTIIRATGKALAVGTLALSVASPDSSEAAYKGLYVNPTLYQLNSSSFQNAALDSGFNAIFLFAASVDSSGTISWGGQTLAQNGSYVGDPTLGSSIASLRSAISRIEIVIGGAGDNSFANIESLINSQGTGSGSILYKNFQALKNATGVDAIQYDDEVNYDVSSSVSFGNMIAGLGMKVTLCPYTAQSYWVSVNSQLGSKVDAIWLQCYSGGAGNSPGQWISAFGGAGDVYPGLWGNTDTPGSVTAKMRNWQSSLGITGGYMWLNGQLPGDAPKWAQALAYGLDPIPYFMVVNKNSQMCMELYDGNSNNDAAIEQESYNENPNQRWCLTPTEDGAHFKLLNWTSGKVASIANDSSANGAVVWNYEYNDDNFQKWDVSDGGSGHFKIRNVGSGLLLEVASGSKSAGATIDQYGDDGTDAQLWKLNPYGNYYLHCACSGKYLCVQGAATTNASPIVQYDWQDNSWFQWNFLNMFDGWYAVYTLDYPQNGSSGQVVSVSDDTSTPGQICWLWSYNNDPAQRSRIWPLTNGTFNFLFSHDGLAWDIVGAGTGDNVPLDQYTPNGTAAQQFWMERVQ